MSGNRSLPSEHVNMWLQWIQELQKALLNELGPQRSEVVRAIRQKRAEEGQKKEAMRSELRRMQERHSDMAQQLQREREHVVRQADRVTRETRAKEELVRCTRPHWLPMDLVIDRHNLHSASQLQREKLLKAQLEQAQRELKQQQMMLSAVLTPTQVMRNRHVHCTAPY